MDDFREQGSLVMWKTIGFFSTPGTPEWMSSHAQLPVSMLLSERDVRVFFAGRTPAQRSHISYVDLRLNAQGEGFDVLHVADQPVLSPGPAGHFDEHGVYPGSIVQHNGLTYLYYIGWIQGIEPPVFYAAIGLAISEDGLNFRRHSPVPLLDRSPHDPCLVTSPHVFVDKGVFRMTYVSGLKWERRTDGGLQSYYHIKQARASNPFDWDRRGDIAIDLGPGETNVARSSVIRDHDGLYKMWFSYVHKGIGKYRIGYAQSRDAWLWERRDALAGIDIGAEHAKEMMAYPHVFAMGEDLFMLYNGDGYGKNGFGIAKRQAGL